MRVRFVFEWYDLWVGLYYNTKKKRLYVFPLPMCGFYIERKITGDCSPFSE